MSLPIAFIAARIFDGEAWLSDHAVLCSHSRIEAVLPLAELSADIPQENFEGGVLAPALMDLQIYGASGKLLAVYPEVDALKRLNEYCRSGGAAWCMPTVATNPYETFYRCIDAIADYWAAGGQGVLGLHVEGPWMNPVKRGAHIESLIHSPTLDQVRQLINYRKGVIRMITLAPEVCTQEIVDFIQEQGIVVSAGHSNATYDEAKQAFRGGIRTVTHLYNAMSPLQHRAPGLVGATLDDDKVMASIIPDGHHVDFAAIRIAKQVMKERLYVITDAVTETDKGPYPHHFEGDKYESGGILSGSALTMFEAVNRLVKRVRISWEEAIRMCSLYPARVIGMEQEAGRIKKGWSSKMMLLDKEMNLVKVIG